MAPVHRSFRAELQLTGRRRPSTGRYRHRPSRPDRPAWFRACSPVRAPGETRSPAAAPLSRPRLSLHSQRVLHPLTLQTGNEPRREYVPRRVLFRPAAVALLPTGKRRFMRGEFWDMTVPMLMIPAPIARTRFGDWPFAVMSILGFWLFYALTVAVRAFLGSDPWTMLENKLMVIGIGILITGVMYVAISAL